MSFIARNVEMVKRTGKPHVAFWPSAGAWVSVQVATCLYLHHSPRGLPRHIAELDARASHYCRTRNQRI